MRHLVYGSGLIGSYIGSVLKLNSESVTLAARGVWEERLSSKITLTDYLDHQAEVDVHTLYTKSDDYQPDIIWLTVKCTAVEQAAEELEALVNADTVIICCQNGIGSHQPILTQFPDNPVLRAVVPFNVVWIEPGRLHRGSEGALVIEQKSDLVPQLVSSLEHKMLPVKTNQDIEGVQWAKLQLNVGNGINALADIPVKAMLTDRRYRFLIANLMDELLAVCRAAARPLPRVARLPGHWLPTILRLPDWLFNSLASQMLAIDPKVKTSMWWDLKAGNPTEKQYLYGAVVKEGQRVGVLCPKNQAMLALIEEAEKTSLAEGSWQSMDAETLEQKIGRCE